MGSIRRNVERRLRALEEQDALEGWDAALHALSQEDKEILYPWAERAHAADEAGEPRPTPTKEQGDVIGKLADLRRRAIREGWPPPPPRPWDGLLY